MSSPNRVGRRRWASIACAMACSAAIASWCAGAPGVREAVSVVVAAELRMIGELAGVHDSIDRHVDAGPLDVTLVQEGGPLWLRETLADAVHQDRAFGRSLGPHLLRTECVHGGRAYAIRMSLFRRGWNLRTPRERRVQVVPEIAVGAALLGAALNLRVLRFAPAVLAAGLGAQCGAQLLDWPEPLARESLSSAWSSGPLWTAIVWAAQALPAAGVPWLCGLVVFALCLIVIDHRRSRSQGHAPLVWGMVASFGVILWVEAALRLGFAGWARTWPGGIALVCVAIAWIAARRWTRQ